MISKASVKEREANLAEDNLAFFAAAFLFTSYNDQQPTTSTLKKR
jgi:hypothetical protein